MGLKDHREKERAGLFAGMDRLLLQCRDCSHYFYILKKDFNNEIPLKCIQCGTDDRKPYGPKPELSSIACYNDSSLSAKRWREGFFRENHHFPAGFNPASQVVIPSYFFDYIMPHLKRLEILTVFILKRFQGSSSGWTRISQGGIAQRLSQVNNGKYKDADGIHIPARQSIASALAGLESVFIIISWKDQEVRRPLLSREDAGGRSCRYMLNLDLPQGSSILRVEREDL